MTDYGKGAILGAANILPATTGAGLLLLNNTSPVIVAGLFLVSLVSLVVLVGTISRFIINSLRKK
ncbi:MAG TPA: hypothetical protein VG935_03645 [Patescibacteria group bacterium]|nr:hypothetical protein [Patescibacteria group bacterium]